MGKVAKEDVLPTNYEVLQRELPVLDVMTTQPRPAHLGGRAQRIGSEGGRLATRRRSSTRKTNLPKTADVHERRRGHRRR